MTTPLPAAIDVGEEVTGAWLTQVSEWIASAGVWQSYTPTLIGVTTNPTLGTGNTRAGQYRQINDTVKVHVLIQFGSSGIAAGNGNYSISLPVAAAGGLGGGGNPGTIIGHGVAVAGGNYYILNVVIFSSGTVQLHYYSAASNASRTVLAHNAPGGWTADDFIVLDFEYEAA